MAQHGSRDQSNNAPIWAAAQSSLTPNTANRDALYGNSTATGLFAVDSNEIAAAGGSIAHTGWIRRVVGTGGRLGRIMTEVLVAGGIVTDEANDAYAQYVITISVQPQSKSVNNNLNTTFSVGAVSVPVDTLTYKWQANSGSGFANLTNSGVYSNVTTSTLSISNVAGLNAVSYRVIVSTSSASPAITATSSNATLTVV